MIPVGRITSSFLTLLLLSLLAAAVPGTVRGQEGSAGAPQPSGKAVSEALYYDAVRARLKGDDAQAEQLFQQFSSKNPNEPAAFYELSRLALRQNKPDKAEQYIRKAVALDQSNKWYQDQYANILAMRNEFVQAGELYEKLGNKEQHNEEYLLKSALLYQRGGRYKEALRQLDQLLKKNPGDEDLLLQQQQLYLKMNDLDGAVAVVRKLMQDHPKEARYYALLADLYENNKREQDALKVYEEAQKLFPDDPAVQLALAEHYKKRKDLVRYNEYVRKAITNKALDAENQMALLVSYLQEQAVDTAGRRLGLDLAGQVATQHGSDADVQSFYGDVLSLNNRREEAIAQYKKSLALDPSKFRYWQQLLFAYTGPRDADSLVVWSEKALKLFPNQALAHYLNGVGQFNKKNNRQAVKAILRGIDMQPEEEEDMLAQMYMTLGDAYQADKQYAESDSAYEHALRLDPKNATVLNNYAYYLSVRGVRLDQAEKMSRKSLEIRPDEPTFQDTYGWILYKQGKYTQAREYLQKAIKADPDNADGTLWDHLGDVLYRLHEVDQAVENWKKARQLGADNPQLDRKIQDRKLYE